MPTTLPLTIRLRVDGSVQVRSELARIGGGVGDVGKQSAAAFPAHAGMNLIHRGPVPQRARVPRTLGDEPK